VLLAEMAIRGPWVSVPEPLFMHREHEQRYTRAVLQGDRSQAALWLDTSDPSVRASRMFHLVVYRHYHLPDVLRDLVKDHRRLRRRLRTAKAKLLGALRMRKRKACRSPRGARSIGYDGARRPARMNASRGTGTSPRRP
jgi:hypothetical protein